MSDATARTHTPEPIKKLMQLQIERLKKEDDEEQWISGEELYTEGSSDEDDTATRVKRKGREERARVHRKVKEIRDKVDVASIRGKHMQRKEACVKESPKKIPLGVNTSKDHGQHEEVSNKKEETKPDTLRDPCDRLVESEEIHSKEDEKAEESNEASGGVMLSEPEISWRPKRGSIKLPSLNYEGRVELVSNSQTQ